MTRQMRVTLKVEVSDIDAPGGRYTHTAITQAPMDEYSFAFSPEQINHLAENIAHGVLCGYECAVCYPSAGVSFG